MLLSDNNQQRWLEESGQCLENVDRTHLILASRKPVLKKPCVKFINSHKDPVTETW